jgi:hypothetical protein
MCMAMDKTTVYLTPELRRALRETARRRRTSEAALIREGIAVVTSPEPAPRPRLPLFESGDPTLAERVDVLMKGFGDA